MLVGQTSSWVLCASLIYVTHESVKQRQGVTRNVSVQFPTIQAEISLISTYACYLAHWFCAYTRADDLWIQVMTQTILSIAEK